MRKLIDEVDSKIIHMLKKNGRMPNTELAKKLKISETAIRKRLKRLFDNELIQIVAVVNHLKLGHEIEGNIKIKIDTKKTEHVIKKLDSIDGIWYIAHLTGASDFDAEFSVRSQGELRDLLSKINKINGVVNAEPSFRLQLIKNRYDWETPKGGAMPV
ncbi:MAG: AsnC family transcriptional regulator [Desulfobacterales bacterium]|nr:AsnC family transcriptional regulator [Desulfobacterales bacterium]